eukprot:CAMPEP_0114261972 /NCGR_PEP_ID=MMETSP0058-20121206/21482_1 /TAXON_ID=36894 /ORGANISM="Pyramimonas parkeae, CCMP726" /LENGTH=248 /DNA_ID=CAMNT_0001377663 /DNA_START=723 /DNA_END=1467 /DNA_ORIENTATION=+
MENGFASWSPPAPSGLAHEAVVDLAGDARVGCYDERAVVVSWSAVKGCTAHGTALLCDAQMIGGVCLCCVCGRYLIVAGGIDGARRYNDIFVLNTERMEWEVIDNGEGVEILSWKPRGVYSAFQGSRLLSVKPNRDEALDELEITDIQLPESLEELWQQRAAKSEDLEKLEIRDDAQTFPNAIEVSWKAPPKLVDRVDRFKLMMANNTGVVKEVCQGKYDRFRVTGLRANTEYVFCVKAIYDDGTHVW